GNAFGGVTSASFASALSEVTVLDQYGRDYTGDLSALVLRPGAASEGVMNRQVEAQFNARSAGFVRPEGSAFVGVTAFDTGLRDAAGVPVLENRLTNAEIAYRLTDAITLTGGFNSAGNVTDDIMGLAPSSDAMFAYAPYAQTSLGLSHGLGNGRVALAAYRGGEGEVAVDGAVLQYRQEAHSLKLGVVQETGSVFGTPVGMGMLRFGDGARTWFVEGASGFDIGRVSVEGFGSLGQTRLTLGPDVLLSDAGAITTGRFGLIGSYPALGGRLSLGLAQPLVVLGGDASLSIGSGYDLDRRALLLQDRKVNLAGEIAPQFTFGFEKRGERSDLRFGMASDARARDIRGIASWRLRLGK
ncbi:MAG: peptidase S8, partial [Erythrobacter sp.]|nr:peptidase S8 [Erythrobacter sp.]